jgi:hypothetical protein
MLKEEMKTKRASIIASWYMVMINNNTRSSRVGLIDGGDNDDDRHACYAKVIVMHTFDEVGVVDVDMHPSTFPSFTVYLPFLRCSPPPLPPFTSIRMY